LSSVPPPRRSAIVLGPEGTGLPPPVAQACELRVTIPMQGNTDSLNVAMAGGIFLHHVRMGQKDYD